LYYESSNRLEDGHGNKIIMIVEELLMVRFEYLMNWIQKNLL